MMSGIIKRVLAFTICIAMLTGSIPANAEGTVSGSAIPAVTSSTTSDSSDTLDENKDTNLGNDADSDSNQNNNSGSDSDANKVIDDEKTPTGPAPSTDGTSSVPGGTVSGNKGDQTTVSENKNSETVSENKAEETVSDNSVSDNTLSGNSIEYLTWSQTVDGVTITVSANKLSVPEGTDLSVDQLDPVEVEVLENTIAEEEEQESIVIKKYKAFDITLVNDGEPVTPSEEVKVTFTGDILVDEMEDGDELKVYHLDEAATETKIDDSTGEEIKVAALNDMSGTIESDSVVMQTPHFSTYLLAINATAAITVDFKYYQNIDGTDVEIFTPNTKAINQFTDSITIPAKDGSDYELSRIEIWQGANNTSTSIIKTLKNGVEFSSGGANDVVNINLKTITPAIVFDKYTLLKMYYVPTASTTEIIFNNITLFDYTDNKINDNYKSSYENRYLGINYNSWGGSHALWMNKNPDGTTRNANIATDQVILGLVKKWENDNVVMGKIGNNQIVEPGYFSTTPVNGKIIYAPGTSNAYKMYFSKQGNAYDLQGVTKQGSLSRSCDKTYINNSTTINKNFFPLSTTSNSNSYNHLYGMKYEVDFTLGDYIGPLEYEFSGDDDVWVFLDGKLVLDIGGIHGTYTGGTTGIPNKINLWNAKDLGAKYYPGDYQAGEKDKLILPTQSYLSTIYDPQLNPTQYAAQQAAKEQKHTIVVLYMDRQYVESSCNMKFVLPNCESEAPTTTEKPKIDVKFNKVDSFDNTVKLNGAEFKLQKLGEAQAWNASSVNGLVTFANIVEGQYVLTETTAPANYKDTTQQWLVNVVRNTSTNALSYTIKLYNNGTSGAEIGKSSGTYFITNDKIYTVLPTKTAQLLNWDDRTYTITLGAVLQFQNSNVSNAVTKSGFTIVDKIDSRFEITQQSINAITASGGVVTTENGIQQVTWTNQTISGATPTPLWNKSIIVKAKNTYMGGNDVTTNAAGSGVYPDGQTGSLISFGQPTVNVKVLFTLSNITDTIFLGETLEDYFTTTKQLAVTTPVLVSGASQVTITEIQDITMTTLWYADENYTVPLTVDQIKLMKPEEEITYYAKVTVTPKTSGANSESNMLSPLGNMGTVNKYFASVATSNSNVTGKYHIMIKTGKILITKQIDAGAYKQSQGDPIFTFKVTEQTTNKTYYRTVRFNNASTTSISAAITELPKGNYKVEELKTMGFALKANGVTVNTNGNDSLYCNPTVTNNSVVFDIGSKSGQPPIFKQYGSVTFMNEKIRSQGKLTYTDAVKNTFVITNPGVSSGMTAEENVDNNRDLTN